MKENFEQPQGPEKKEKREMGTEEVEKMGEEMEEYYQLLQGQIADIEEKLAEPGISEERRKELEEDLELVKEQLEEDWKDFVSDIKSREWSEAKIDK